MLILIIPAVLFPQNQTLKGIILCKSKGNQPEANVQLIPLDDANPVRTGTDGKFSLTFLRKKAGEPVTVLVQAREHQVLGPDEQSIRLIIPEDPQHRIVVAIVRTADFDRRVDRIVATVEKRIAEQNQSIQQLVAQRGSGSLEERERKALTEQIAQLHQQVQELERNKAELARRLAQTDLDQASGFAREALRKFEEEGSVEAALALLSEDRLDQFWEQVVKQEEKVREAKAQGVENYMIRARMLAANFQFQEAYKAYLEALERDSTQVDNLLEISEYLHKLNDQPRALKYYSKALAFARDRGTRSKILNNRGNVLLDMFRYEEAKRNYQEALEIRQELAAFNPEVFLPELARTLNNLGNLYADIHQPEKAEEFYRASLETGQSLSEVPQQIYRTQEALTLNNYGNLLASQNRFDEANTLFDRALATYRELAEQDPKTFLPKVGSTLSNYALLLINTGQMELAERHFTEALALFDSLDGAQEGMYQYDLGIIYYNMGDLYKKTSREAQAESVYLKSLDIWKEIAEVNPETYTPLKAQNFSVLGRLYFSQERLDEAERHFGDAHHLYTSLSRINPVAHEFSLLENMSLLAEVCSANQKPAEALRLYEEVLTMLEEQTSLPLNPQEKAQGKSRICGKMAWCYLLIGKPELAEQFAGRALALDPSRKLPESTLALAHLYQGNWKKAAQIFNAKKDSDFNEQITWREAFLFDLEDLEAAGVTHPDAEKAKKLLKK